MIALYRIHLRECEAALHESHGSYTSLLSLLKGKGQGNAALAEQAENWDGPICARRYFEKKKGESYVIPVLPRNSTTARTEVEQAKLNLFRSFCDTKRGEPTTTHDT